MKISDIITTQQDTNNILSSKAEWILAEDMDKMVPILKDMAEFCNRTNKAVGLALPQLGYKSRGFVISAKNPLNRRETIGGIYINPTIISHGGEDDTDIIYEECLSEPGVKLPVERYKNIVVEYTNIKGVLVNKSLSGFHARVFQHELDHLEGILIANRFLELIKKGTFTPKE